MDKRKEEKEARLMQTNERVATLEQELSLRQHDRCKDALRQVEQELKQAREMRYMNLLVYELVGI